MNQMIGLEWNADSQQIDITTKPASQLSWFENAITVSLFTDKRASNDEVLPDSNSDDRRGHWGDIFLDSGDSLGSRLWLLEREKLTPETLRLARDYCYEALEWLALDGYALRVEVSTERQNNDRINILINIEVSPNEWLELNREYQYAV